MYHGFEHQHAPPRTSAITAWLVRCDAILASRPQVNDPARGTEACDAVEQPPRRITDAISGQA